MSQYNDSLVWFWEILNVMLHEIHTLTGKFQYSVSMQIRFSCTSKRSNKSLSILQKKTHIPSSNCVATIAILFKEYSFGSKGIYCREIFLNLNIFLIAVETFDYMELKFVYEIFISFLGIVSLLFLFPFKLEIYLTKSSFQRGFFQYFFFTNSKILAMLEHS